MMRHFFQNALERCVQGARSYEGVGDDQSGREVSSAEAPSGGETIASGEKIGKSGCKVGGGKNKKKLKASLSATASIDCY